MKRSIQANIVRVGALMLTACLLLLILLLQNVDAPPPSGSTPPLTDPATETEPEPEPKEPEPTAVEPPLAQYATEISICQKQPPPPPDFTGSWHESACFLSLDWKGSDAAAPADLPRYPDTYALMMQDIYFYITIRKDEQIDPEQLLAQIAASGGSLQLEPSLSLSPEHLRFRGEIRDIGEQAALSFGDGISPVRFVRSDKHLSYTATVTAWDDADSAAIGNKAPLLITDNQNTGMLDFLLVPAGAKEIVLEFNEPVAATQMSSIQSQTLHPVWLDASRVRIELPATTMPSNSRLEFHHTFSATGNYLANPLLSIRTVPSAQWLNYPDNTPVTDSPFAAFYDYMLFSPDREAMLGFVYVSGSLVDESGSYYALVLEQPGQPPEIVVPVLHVPFPLEQAPVHWIDNRSFAYLHRQQLIRRDLEQPAPVRLLGPAELNKPVGTVVHDPWSRQLYVYTYYTHQTDAAAQRLLYVGRWTVSTDRNNQQPPLYEPDIITAANWTRKYILTPLPFIAGEHGAYRTMLKSDGQPETSYEARDGTTHTMDGMAITVDGNAVYLQRQELRRDNPGYGEPPHWLLWTPGAEPQPLPKPSEHRREVRPFGPYLVAAPGSSSTDDWLIYDRPSNEWRPMPLAAGRPHLPSQTSGPIYRIELSAQPEAQR